MDELLELKMTFLEEAELLVEEAEELYMTLEENVDSVEDSVLDHIFRNAHSLKGSALAVGFTSVGEFTHELEHFLLKLKNRELQLSGDIVSVLLKCNDHIKAMLADLATNPEATHDSAEFVTALHAAAEATDSAEAEEPEQLEAEEQAVEEEEHVEEQEEVTEEETAEEELPSDEELLAAPIEAVPDASAFGDEGEGQATEQQAVVAPVEAAPSAASDESETPAEQQPVAAEEPKPTEKLTVVPDVPNAAAGSGQKVAVDEKIRVSQAKIDKLLNAVGEMTILQSVMAEQVSDVIDRQLQQSLSQLGKIAVEVQDTAMSLRMVPAKPVFQKLSRIVRDTSKALDKEINFVSIGEEVEVDKTVLDNISDPLVHLIRNAVDHGIEAAEDRVKNGKPEKGTIKLSAIHEEGKLVFYIIDDGGGIDGQKLVKKAKEKKILAKNAEISDDEATNLIFHAGFSTKEQVTDVSGRGVGMDVVKTNIEKLSGAISVETELGKGTTFKVALPLTMAIVDAVIVEAGSYKYAIPLAHVHESIKPREEQMRKSDRLGDILLLREENIPMYTLSQISPAIPAEDSRHDAEDEVALIIRSEATTFALRVDNVVNKQQIVVKAIGKEIQHLNDFGGSTILGDGKPALILEVTHLVKRLTNKAQAVKALPKKPEVKAA